MESGKFLNITCGIITKYHYMSCYYLYWHKSGYIFHHYCFLLFLSVFFSCTRNYIYYTSVSCVWFLLPANYSKQQKNLDLSVKNYLNPFKCRITYSNSRLARVSNILGCNVTSLLPSKSLKQEGNWINQIIKVAFSMTCLFRGISKSQRAPLYVDWISKVFIVSCYRL